MTSQKSGYPRWVALVVLFTLSSFALLGSSATAGFIGPMVTIRATSDEGASTASWNLPTGSSEDGEIVMLDLGRSQKMRTSSGAVIAEIEDLIVKLNGDPAVDLNFVVTAGNFDTTFTVTSATVGFDPIMNPTAFASAGVTLTDSSSFPGDGASLDPIAPNTSLYRAVYNGGTQFAELLSSVSLTGSGTASASGLTGSQVIAGPVSQIQGQFSFKVSARDQASGTSRFEVVPEPGTVVLFVIGLGALGASIRRRDV